MQNAALVRIREQIEMQLGRRVWIKAYGGRSRSMVNEGMLEDAFPSVFTVAIRSEEREGEPRRISYTYGEILTNDLEMRLLD